MSEQTETTKSGTLQNLLKDSIIKNEGVELDAVEVELSNIEEEYDYDLSRILDKKKKEKKLKEYEIDFIRDEQIKLIENDKIVRKGADVFVSVGLALAEVKERKLHKLENITFEKYVHDRLGISRAQADRTIKASCLSLAMEGQLDSRMTTESHVRQLLPLKDTDLAVEAFNAACKVAKAKGKRISAGLIKAQAKKLKPEAYPEPTKLDKAAIKNKLSEAIQDGRTDDALAFLAQL